MRGTLREKTYQELGLDSLQQGHWYRKLCRFFKIYKNQCPKYLFDIICNQIVNVELEMHKMSPISMWNTSFFKNSYFPSIIIEWNTLTSNICSSETLNIFKWKILKFIKPTANSTFGCHSPVGVKPLTRLWLGLSHLCEHKFKQSFQDTLNPLCSCRKEVETTFHFLFLDPNYSDEKLTLLSKIRSTNPNIIENTNSQITLFFLYGDKNLTALTNFIIISLTVEYLLATKRFVDPLFH